ncbi:MAG: type I DNA topoisomerase, partial [Candidatus Zipacnadales bacterium]
QQARRVLDRLVGYLISPLLWKRIKTKQRSLSAGRVQSAALRMIVEREREIGAFQPTEYWTIEALLTPVDREAPFTAELQTRDGEKLELHNAEEAEATRAELQQAQYVITSLTTQRRSRNPQPPFITSTLQQQAATALGFSASKTMRIAQQLYEGVDLDQDTVALITYMRTDSTRIADTARAEAVNFIKERYGESYVGPGVKGKPKGTSHVQDAHEAVRPTHIDHTPESLKGHLTPDQHRLYTLIWRRFVASQMAPAVFDVTTVEIQAGRYGLRASGSVPVFAGFRAVYEEAKVNGDEEKESKELPVLQEGEGLKLLELRPEQHFTKSPPRYTEASLVRALEESGIGRPSTYAQIIETLRQRKYVEMYKRTFVPTRLGVTVCDYLVQHFPHVMDIQFTAHVENDLDTVERGEQDWVQLVRQFYEPLRTWIEQAENAPPRQLKERCPECGGALLEHYAAAGRFAGCENFPQCGYTRDLDLGLPQPEVPELGDENCPQCGQPLAIKQSSKGLFVGCTGYPQCRYTQPVRGEAEGKPPSILTDIPCEKCGQPLVIRHGKRGPFLGCSGYPQCRATRSLTAEEAQRYSIVGEGIHSDTSAEKLAVKCPECGAEMVVRQSRRGPFWGCSNYPQCRGTAPLKGTSAFPQHKSETPIEEPCPACGKPLMVRRGQRGRFIGCTGYPECRYTRNVEKTLTEDKADA